MLRRKSRGSLGGGGVIWGLFTLAIVIVVGALLFTKVFVKLDAERDKDFTAEANATIAGVQTDFYDAVDLLRIALIIVPIIAILAYVFLLRGKQ